MPVLANALFAFVVAAGAFVPSASFAMEMELAGDVLFLHGGRITLDDWVQYRELTKDKRFSRVVLVNQGGGAVETALGIADDLVARRVTTIALGYCLSACTYVFLAGEQRQFGAAWPVSRTRLGFHGVYDVFFGTPTGRTGNVASYYESRLHKRGWALLQRALEQLPDRRGFAYVYHPSHRGEASLCPGSVDYKCERIADSDAATLGIITSRELADVSLPQKLAAKEQLFGIESSALERVSSAQDLEKRCPAGADACVRSMRSFAERPAERAVALSPSGNTGVSWQYNQPGRAAWRALYECVRKAGEPCRVVAVNDYLAQALYDAWARDSIEALDKLKTLAADKIAEEHYELTEFPMRRLRTDSFTGPTPETIPGVKEVTSRRVVQLISGKEALQLIDVWCGNATLPSAKCVFGAGLAYSDPGRDQAHGKLFLALLDALAPDRQAQIVLFSVNDRSWLSANAAYRAAQAGRNVLWYRGGVNAWRAAGLPTVSTAPVGAVSE